MSFPRLRHADQVSNWVCVEETGPDQATDEVKMPARNVKHFSHGARGDDFQPVGRIARMLFYLFITTSMHVDISKRPKIRRSRLQWTFSHTQLLDTAHDEYCHAPLETLELDGAKRWIDALVRAVLPPDSCSFGFSLLGVITSLSLVLSAISGGLPRRQHAIARFVPPCLGAIGMVIFSAIFQASRGSNHRWLLPSLCCVFLSLDDPLTPTPSVRELCITAAACIMGSAGLSKLTASTGWPTLQWADGETLRWHLLHKGRQHLLIVKFFLKHPVILRGAALFTLVIELAGWLLIVLPTRTRAPLLVFLVIAWTGLHIGILLMMPEINYLPSCFTYLTLLLPWASSGAKPVLMPDSSLWKPCSFHAELTPHLNTVLRLFLLCGFAYVCMFHTEMWPFSCIAMFSHLRDETWTDLCLTEAQAMQLAREPYSRTGQRKWYDVELVFIGTTTCEVSGRELLRCNQSLMRRDLHHINTRLRHKTLGQWSGGTRIPRAYQAKLGNVFVEALAYHFNVTKPLSDQSHSVVNPADEFLKNTFTLLESHQQYLYSYTSANIDGGTTNSIIIRERLLGAEFRFRLCGVGPQLLSALLIDGRPLFCSDAPQVSAALSSYLGSSSGDHSADVLQECSNLSLAR